ncbi:class I SAM-dependent methyltransferase [Flavisolibacter sp. BT320]|nr:class I SAM-dependent methyltransferase [Flavisolibacter longurius]
MNPKIKQHWEQVYETKQPDEVSWTQAIPNTSLAFIRSFNLPKTARIIDVGGGDAKLVDYLLAEGFKNITVLDISAHALQRAKDRLGKQAAQVTWIESDVTDFKPNNHYDVWHDRATFHFLTQPAHLQAYLRIAKNAVKGYMTIGTFSTHGPGKCSGLPIRQYNEAQLTQELQSGFTKIRCLTEDHTTPFGTSQNFLFCSFRRSA